MIHDISDLRSTIIPKSDQLNADDLVAGSLDVHVVGVHISGNDDQPISLELEGWRPYKPCKSMRRVLVRLWGADGREWSGRWLRLFCDPTVTWANKEVGGIRISHLSHIERAEKVPVTIKRGQKRVMTFSPMRAPQAATFDLHDVLARSGVTLEQADAWAANKGKPRMSALSDESASAAAKWLASEAGAQALRDMKAGGSEE